jgi:quercetin dioxygenase-like cupin family protein
MSEFRREDALLLLALASGLPEVMPDAVAALRTRDRVMAGVTAAPLSGHAVRNNEREWVPLLPGITIKTLLKDTASGAQTTLWRLQPGACVPPHPHSRDEECLILEGSIVLDAVEYFPGDFVFARAGERHGVISAPNGALFLIRGEPVPDPSVLARLSG